MGTKIDLQSNPVSFGDGYDSLVVREYYTSTDGGVSLDTTGFTKPYIRSGHIIIRKTAAEADGTYLFKPMPLNAGGTAYAALPADHQYYGFLIQSLPTSKPFAGVTQHAKINPLVGTNAAAQAAGVYDMTGLLTALKAALPHVIFQGDKE